MSIDALREVGLEVVRLRASARGYAQEQHGQRRMASRILLVVNEKLIALGEEPIDNGDSYSEDTIDRSLIA